jgi:hypothetical protein
MISKFSSSESKAFKERRYWSQTQFSQKTNAAQWKTKVLPHLLSYQHCFQMVC